MAIDWKKVLKSKTLWVNMVAGLLPIVATQIEAAQSYMKPIHFVIYTAVVTIANFVLRFITSQPLIMKKLEEDDARSS